MGYEMDGEMTMGIPRAALSIWSLDRQDEKVTQTCDYRSGCEGGYTQSMAETKIIQIYSVGIGRGRAWIPIGGAPGERISQRFGFRQGPWLPVSG